MKKLLVMMLIGLTSLMYQKVNAQISLNVNIGSQPVWGPVGYDHVDYYYLPDVESYYSVPKRQFVYLNGNNWVFSNTLPTRYSNYNLYSGYKVVINGDRPYLNYKTHKVKYAKFKGNNGKQIVIRNSNDSRYFIVKGHPKGAAPGQAKKMVYGKGNGSNNGKANNGKGNNGDHGKGKH